MQAAVPAIVSPLSFFPRRAQVTLRQRWERLLALHRGITRRVAVAVPAGTLRRVSADHHEMELHCRRGELWITCDGDCKDMILRAGERWRVDRRRPLEIYAFADSVCEVEMRFGTRASLRGVKALV